MLTLQGQQGRTVVVDGASVRLVKQGCVLGPAREKTLPIRQVLAVEVKKPGGVFAGYIRFATADDADADGLTDAAGRDPGRDENSVVFADLRSYETALQIKDYVEHQRPGKA
jgi:hypothetical protein